MFRFLFYPKRICYPVICLPTQSIRHQPNSFRLETSIGFRLLLWKTAAKTALRG
jgi:hypothetical protein